MKSVATNLVTRAELKSAVRSLEKKVNQRCDDQFASILRITREHNRNLNAFEKRFNTRLDNIHAALSTQMSNFESSIIEQVKKSNKELEEKFTNKITQTVDAILTGLDERLKHR